ncbi:hypothetical protein [Dyadobacter diqingensis]|uniref:hypothetical protein n=1 Tax=Dyadobacter diqingensis TaxID=2938121 RepID=UPI0020C2A0AA|nr:hypothetical protein [Dyadobacter diqingensis]
MTPTDNLFWDYIAPILETQKAEKGVKYVKMSDGNGMDRLLEDSVSEDVYPGIFVLRPKYTTKYVESHILMVNFNTVFYVWCYPDKNDRESQDSAYTHAENIVATIINKLQHDERVCKNFLDFDSIQVEPVLYVSVDSAYGYEVKMKLGLVANHILC